MTNRVFLDMIRRQVVARLPSASADAPKEQLFRLLYDREGQEALFEVGRSLLELPNDPIVRVLTAGETPELIFSCWQRLERFSHSRNRTRKLDPPGDSPGHHLVIEHYALNEGEIHPANHYFIWGLLSALFCRAEFPAENQSTADGAIASFSWPERPWRGSSAPQSSGAVQATKHILLGDIVRPWRIGDVAKRLGLSSRTLQRNLSQASTSFSETLQLARLEEAEKLLETSNLTLTEVAFCTGFSDLAHFSRAARKHFKITATQLQELVGPSR